MHVWQTSHMSSENLGDQEWTKLGQWLEQVQAWSWDKDSYPLGADSVLAGDEHGMPEGASVAAVVRSLLDSSVDDLASACMLAAELGRISPVGIPTLVRGTIELSGLGMWVITGKGRQARQERALRVAHDSLMNAGKFYEHVAKDATWPASDRAEASKRAEKYKAQQELLIADAVKHGLKKTHITANLNRTEALKEVDKARETVFFSNWQLCSGFAHGLSWAAQSFNTFVYTHSMEGGGVLTGRTLEKDSALTLLNWGKFAIEELQGSFSVGRLPVPGATDTAEIRAVPRKGSHDI